MQYEERTRLHDELDRASRHIYNQKHDRQRLSPSLGYRPETGRAVPPPFSGLFSYISTRVMMPCSFCGGSS